MADPRFHAIYVEEDALAWPLTHQILSRHPGCPVIKIHHHKDVLNRPRQHQELQKLHQALILAVKREPLVYEGADPCHRLGADHLAYASLALNCPFSCDYCFLRGMYPSAHLVAFVNLDQFAKAFSGLDESSDLEKSSTLLALSYETDLIALHRDLPYLEWLYDNLAALHHLKVEVRTKSADPLVYESLQPLDHLAIGFSVLPDSVRQRCERRTPPLAARLKAIDSALAHGFAVRLCFDPVMLLPFASDPYEPFFRCLLERYSSRIVDVSYGFFRMPRTYFDRIARKTPGNPVFAGPFETDQSTTTYPRALRDIVQERHLAILRDYLENSRIHLI